MMARLWIAMAWIVLGASSARAWSQEHDSPDAPARSTPRETDRAAEFLRLGGVASRHYAKGEYEAAERALRGQLEIQPDNAAALYNLACCLGGLGREDEAGQVLRRAVEAGFSDLARIEREPTLAMHRALASEWRRDWSRVLEKQRDVLVAANRAEFGDDLRELRDDALRIVLLCAWEKDLAQRTLEELRAVDALARSVLGDAPADATAAPEHTPWVVVVLPRREAFMRWATRTYGQLAKGSFNQIGGSYEHARKRLVAIDSGATLRHEFFHVAQYRWLERAGQSHPIWIMEGLASLVEDVEFKASSLRPVPSWRTNTAQRMEKSGVLVDIADLAKMDQRRFAATRPLANYGAARAFFLFLHDTGRLRAWWSAYTTNAEHGLAVDASGVRAIEFTFDRPMREVEREFRQWLRRLPSVAETIEPGMASLGVEVDAGQGEGPIVTRLLPAGRASPLRPRDVILSIDHRPTRDIAELVRVLGVLRPGQDVRLEVRRGTEVVELDATLGTR